MLKLTSICCAILFAAPAVMAQDAGLAARIDAAIAPAYPSGQPGATIIVVKNGQTVLRKAYGQADVVKKIPMTPDASLRLGSITKQFTAAAIMLLAERGKLSLNDDITRHLSGYPTHGKKITIEHLLTHTSGIPSYTGNPGYMLTMTRDMTTAQMIDSFKDLPLEFDPGTRFKYNNSGYFLLGAIIEKVSGQTYAAFLDQQVFTPLGMANTAYEGRERGKVPRAVGHSRKPDGFVPAAPLSMTQPYAAGALVSTVDDLAKWDAAITAGKLLSRSSWDKMATSYKLADGSATKYGYGFGVGELLGTPSISHGGGINGFSTHAMRLPKENVYVAVLTNVDGGMTSPEQIATRAATLAIGKELPVYRFVALDAKLLDAYVGRYQLRPDFVVDVTRDGNQLLIQGTRQGEKQPSMAIKALGENRFLVEQFGAELRFDRNTAGAVHQFTLFQGGAETVAARID